MGITVAQWRSSIGLFLPRAKTSHKNIDQQRGCQSKIGIDEVIDKDETLKPAQCSCQNTAEDNDEEVTQNAVQNAKETINGSFEYEVTAKPPVEGNTVPEQTCKNSRHQNAIRGGWLKQASEHVSIILLLLVASLLGVLLIRGGVESNPGPSTLDEAAQCLAGISVHDVKKEMDIRGHVTFGQFIHKSVCQLSPEQEYLLGIYLLNNVNRAHIVLNKTTGDTSIKCHLMDVLHHWMNQRGTTTWDDLLSRLSSPSFNKAVTEQGIAPSLELGVRDFLCVIDDHPGSLPCKNDNDIRQFGLSLGLNHVKVQQLVPGNTSSYPTSLAAYDVIIDWSHLQPDDSILDLVRALVRLLSEEHMAVKDLVEGLCELGIAPNEKPSRPNLPPKPEPNWNSGNSEIELLSQELQQDYAKTKGHIEIDSNVQIEIEKLVVELEMEHINSLHKQRSALKSIIKAFGPVGETDRICLFSDAGGGKSVQCQIVAFLWASKGALREKYKLVFLLKLSGLTIKDDYIKLIQSQILSREEPRLKELITKKKKVPTATLR